MVETAARLRDKLQTFGVTMQPVVVVVGSLTSPVAAYVMAADATWKVASPLKAVDICFKAFHVFHASYPSSTITAVHISVSLLTVCHQTYGLWFGLYGIYSILAFIYVNKCLQLHVVFTWCRLLKTKKSHEF
jgi:hypothetical protein